MGLASHPADVGVICTIIAILAGVLIPVMALVILFMAGALRRQRW